MPASTACKNGKVTFGYINSTSNRYQTKTVSATYFLWLVLQHVLPRGFRRSRNYGFLHPNSKKLLKILQWMFRLKIEPLNSTEIKPRPKMICKCCGALMKIVKTKLKISRRLVPI
ncbi:MAG: transposase [Melioribacteraceae bacterium]|nr:transposase [Melioribacteraceae bacterium]